jgi:hypothetical protein
MRVRCCKDGDDQPVGVGSDGARLTAEAFGRPLGIATMARHMLGVGAMPTAAVASGVGGNALAAVKHLDRPPQLQNAAVTTLVSAAWTASVLASPYLHRSKTEESRCEVDADPQADATMAAPIGNPAPPSAPGVAGFKSERWPTSNRKVDRLQIGCNLGQYTLRVALTGGQVSFRWRDYRHHNKVKVMTLAAAEFIRCILLHTVPEGFHCGLLANGHRAANSIIIKSDTESSPGQSLEICCGGRLQPLGQMPRRGSPLARPGWCDSS